jgi:putative protease
MPYDLIVDGARRDIDISYLVSPTDLGAWDRIDQLAKIGVASLKIEGRLKDPHYVAMTAQTYRAAIDEASRGRALNLDPQREADINVVYSRTFTHGFLDGVDHQQLVPGRFPKARGLRVGTVVQRTSRGLFIELDADREPDVLKNGDGIVFDEGHPEEDEPHGQIYRCDAHVSRNPGKPTRLYVELGNRDARPDQIALGAIVWKNSDPQLNKRLEQTFARDRVVHRSSIDLTLIARVGDRPVLRATEGSRAIEATVDHVLQPAMKHPLTEEFARRQLDRLMDTPFELRSLTLQCDGAPMVPASVFSDLRRAAVAKLIEQREAACVHAIADIDALARLTASAAGIERVSIPPSPQVHVLARTVEQVQALCDLPAGDRPDSIYCDFEDVRRYALAVPIARGAGVPITLATMRIIKPGEEGWLQQILNCQPDAILVRNLAGIGFYQQHAPHLPLVGDFSLNIANELTAKIFADAHLIRMVPSYDLSWNQLAAMIERFDPGRLECVVHQHMPMFHMEHCVFARTLSTGKDYRDCGRPCETHKVDLREQIGKSHPLIPDAGCRNTLFNGEAQSAMAYIPRMKELGIVHYRIELLRESPDEARRLIAGYREVIAGRAPARNALRSLRVLSQLGVTAGTLDRE